MGIETMTVHLGLVKASLFSIILLSLGGTLIGIAFSITFACGQYPLLSLLVIAIAAIDLTVLRKLKKLYILSKKQEFQRSKFHRTRNHKLLCKQSKMDNAGHTNLQSRINNNVSKQIPTLNARVT
jgi:hypothetical protein